MTLSSVWDLHVQLAPNQPVEQAQYVRTAEALGYTGIVFTTVIKDRVLAATDSSPFKRVEGVGGKVAQKSRLLYHLHDARSYHALSSINPVLRTYDVLSVRPHNEKVFHHACKQLAVDIISIDISSRLPFYIKKVHVNMALARGIYFEICYAPMLHDAAARRSTISNALHLVQMTGGRNIIISSGATNAMEMRAPYDAQNLALLFRINANLVKATITSSVWEVFMHAEARTTEKTVMKVEMKS